MKEHDIYTGSIIYNNIEFTFVFDKKKLKLIPSKDKEEEIRKWFMKSIGNVLLMQSDPIYITEYLYGVVNETNHKIVFIPSHDAISINNTILVINIDFYILNKYDRDKIDRIAIKGPEITHIFPTTIALNKFDWEMNGKIGVSTKSFDETTTAKESFNIGDKELLIYFGISVSSTYKTGESPISLNSTMFVEFSPTDDYKFIINLIKIVKQFIQYLCYRKNVIFSRIEISAPTSKDLHETFAVLYETHENNIEDI